MSVSKKKEAKLLEGKVLAKSIRENIKKEIESFLKQGYERPFLLAIQVTEDPSADWYIGQQEKLAQTLGITFGRIAAGAIGDQASLLEKISESNQSAAHGIFMAMPFPEGFDADQALMVMDPKKDVEGIHPTSLGLIVLRKEKLIPPTAYAAFQLIKASGIELRGKRATIIGQSAIVGRPLQLLLGQHRVTTTVCNTGTSEEDAKALCLDSDIVVACAGNPKMVKGDWIKEGAVVIDVGTTEVDGKLVGDVDFDAAKENAGFITPVPGGVGPLTVTMLMQNLMNAYKWQKRL